MEKNYRYPGTRPFLEKDRALFFGRDNDIKLLSQRIVLEKLVVLVGRSGFGKTSLLYAGVIPRLIEQERHVVLNIHLKEQARNPMDLLLRRLEGFINDKTFLTDKFNIATELPNDLTAKLWYYAKIIQLLHEGAEAVTLVFDHFEELFVKYPNEVDAFGQSMATLLNFKSPKSVRSLLKQKVKSNENYFSETEIEQLLAPLNLKVVFSLRNDYMGELDRLKIFLPEVFSHTYELLPLSGPQALEALQKPAQIKGGFSSPSFTYTHEVLEQILDGLKNSKNKRIEAFQLQLIGQRAEESMASKKKANPETTKFQFTAKELGKLDAIWEGHYKRIIASLPFKNRRPTKNFIEKALIVDGSRVPVDEATITSIHKIPKNQLEALVEKLLLRSEPNSVGSTSYELSHDTLVEPILKSAEKRRKKEMRWLLIALGFIALLFMALWLFEITKVEEDKENPMHEEIIDSLLKLPREKVIRVGFPTKDSLNFTVRTFPCTPNTKASVTITATNNLEGYRYEITQPDGTILGPQTQNAFFNLTQIGTYTITVTDAMGTSVNETFNVTEDCNFPRPPLSSVDEVSFNNVLTKPGSPDAVAVNIDSILYTDIDEIIDDIKPIGIKNWRFNKSEVHLVGIGIQQDSILASEIKKVLLLLLVDNKVFMFDASMPAVNEKFFRLKQIKYSLKIPFFGNTSKYRLRLEGRYYTDFNGKQIPYKETDSLERYKVFGEIIKDYKYEDNIYYSFLDLKDFDRVETEKKYSRIYGILQ